MRKTTTEESYDVSGYREAPVRYARVRRRGGWVTLLAVLLVLAALVAVADRVAANIADRQLREKVATELHTRNVGYDTLDVAIGGFPFLTQVVRGSYEQITIDLTQMTLPTGSGGANAAVPALHVVARGVKANTADVVAGTAKVSAAAVTGSAVVPFATLQSLIDFSRFDLTEVKVGESAGGLTMSAKLTRAGISVPISATADITLAGNQFTVRLRDASAVSLQAPQVVKDYLGDLVSRTVTAKLPQLPFGLTVDRFVVAPAGLAITATGHDVALAR